MKQLYKTTIVIWSEFNPENYELDALAIEATNGNAYCSFMDSELIEKPQEDGDWGDTEFFGKHEDYGD